MLVKFINLIIYYYQLLVICLHQQEIIKQLLMINLQQLAFILLAVVSVEQLYFLLDLYCTFGKFHQDLLIQLKMLQFQQQHQRRQSMLTIHQEYLY